MQLRQTFTRHVAVPRAMRDEVLRSLPACLTQRPGVFDVQHFVEQIKGDYPVLKHRIAK